MSKFILLFFLGASSAYANTTYLDCNVRGKVESSYESRNLRDSRVTVEIFVAGKNYMSIIISGEDDYMASVSTMKEPNRHVTNFSTDSKYDITNVDNRQRGKILSSTDKITINRLSGHLSVSRLTDFTNNNFINTSYTGNCNKVTGKKF
jgi:hypothetical protein